MARERRPDRTARLVVRSDGRPEHTRILIVAGEQEIDISHLFQHLTLILSKKKPPYVSARGEGAWLTVDLDADIESVRELIALRTTADTMTLWIPDLRHPLLQPDDVPERPCIWARRVPTSNGQTEGRLE